MSDFETLPPSPAELEAIEARKKAEQLAAEKQFIAQTKAWIENRRGKDKLHTNERIPQ